MSIKNQKTLLISASSIIALTVIGLFGLNFLVEKIAKITPASIVMAPPSQPPPTGMPAKDDAFLGQQPPGQMPPRGLMPPQDDRFPSRRRPDMREQPPRDRPFPPGGEPVRRLRNGKDAPDLRRSQPPTPSKDDAVDNGQRARPPMPPSMGGYPPSMDPSKMDPKEREQLENEIQRRQEMYYGSPPNGYYPPQGPPNYDYYDNGYDRQGEPPPSPYDYGEYDYDYYYEPDSESNLSAPEKDIEKTAEIIDEPPEDDEYDPDYEEIDDYLSEYED